MRIALRTSSSSLLSSAAAFVSLLVLCANAALAQPRGTQRSASTAQAPVTEENPYSTQAETNPYSDPSATEVNPYAADAPPGSVDAAPDLAADGGRPPREKSHSVGLGFHTTTFATQAGNGYSMSGPSVVYEYSVGRTWAFMLRGEAYFPMTVRMAGNGADERASVLDNYSRRHFGFDGSFMVAYRASLGERFVLTGAGGLHFQSFRLVAADFNPIEAITGGFALLGRADYRVASHFRIGLEFAMGIDPIDFVHHANRATITVPMTVSVVASLPF